ncbi:hypothetical protein [Candidatus Lucifugimonas marina]|uniref:Uncharacterized protein n=1 Tax=Candidatus Lucifugimonas marina TaxID=3038979 RepID=A0AAJ5ZGH0_9CHLR|nr:hypothetical protein [SAR202 cluster bacterium JH702]MDG0868330.1 hypothetical protein [SAR202 cluster bacterium JH639]WFG34968.1 hypothetical protein GKN94_04445 [SAR202 cluster bacterium JH545]WFG38925.1 hypothetical protein GKO48_04610 [SAR202 cluster bacterium JH1073]
MNTQPHSDSIHEISRLQSAAHTGSLKAVVRELASICKDTSTEQCTKLTELMPRLSVETAMHKVRVFN